MKDIEDRIEIAQWMLERQLQWIAQAETKVGALVTLDLAMLGGLAAAYGAAESHSTWANLFSVIACFFQALGMFFAAMCLLPRLQAPHSSVLFFGQVASMSASDYVQKVQKLSADQLLLDWLFQVHRNSEVARDKHKWVKKATVSSFLSAPFWIGAITILVKV